MITSPLLAMLLLSSTPTTPQRTREWVAHMDGLAVSLSSMLVNANAHPIDDERRAMLRQDITVLRSLAHRLSTMRTPDADPTIGFLLHELDGAIDDTARADDDAIADAALAVAWTCMGCHARAAYGTPRPLASLAPIDMSLPPDVRGVALAATRRFNDALGAFRSAVFDEELAASSYRRWERSVRGALLLEMRVQHDARGALEIVEQTINTPAGERLWQDAVGWRNALWPMVRTNKAWPRTLEALDAEAERLMNEASTYSAAAPEREIVYLRATALAHEILMRDPPKPMRAQALAWLGEGYAGLRDLDIWWLHLVYDAACIEAAPHSLLAAECYARWLDGARSAFTGNGGGALPAELETERLRLRAIVVPR